MILSNNPTRQIYVIIKSASTNGNQKKREKETKKQKQIEKQKTNYKIIYLTQLFFHNAQGINGVSKSFKPQDDKLDKKLGTVVLKSVAIWRTNEAFTHLTVSSNLQVVALLSSGPHLGAACHPEKGNTTV